MKSFVLCLLALCLVLVLSVSSYACPVALQQQVIAAPLVDHCAVQLQAAPIVQHYVAPETAAIVVQRQVQYAVAPQIVYQRQAVVLQQNVHVQHQRQFRTPVRDAIQNRQNIRAQRQNVRAAQRAAVVVHPQDLIVAPY